MHSRNLARAGITSTITSRLRITTLDLSRILAICYLNIRIRYVFDDGGAVGRTTGPEFDPYGLGRVDHVGVRDIDVRYHVCGAGAAAERPDRDAVGAGTGDCVYGDVGGAGFEGNAVVLVGDGDVGDGDECGLGDVPAVGIFWWVAGGGAGGHGQFAVGNVFGASRDVVEDIGGIEEFEVGDGDAT